MGCVIVRDGRVTGRGWTGTQGRPHAETAAIADAGEGARGATAYVSLEPCAHHGRTPPCSRALIDAGVARVVTPISDPDERVSGRGHRELELAGISVSTGLLQREAREAHAGFLSRILRARPYMTLKLATSLDGRLATAAGASRWITGSAARRYVHMERARHDAVLVGRGTVAADDPDLAARLDGLDRSAPVKVFFDSTLRTPLSSRLGQAARTSRVCVVHTSDASTDSVAKWEDAGATTIEVGRTASGLADTKLAIAALADSGTDPHSLRGRRATRRKSARRGTGRPAAPVFRGSAHRERGQAELRGNRAPSLVPGSQMATRVLPRDRRRHDEHLGSGNGKRGVTARPRRAAAPAVRIFSRAGAETAPWPCDQGPHSRTQVPG